MIGSGKYDFPGIRKAGTAGLKAAVAGTTWGAAIFAGPFKRTASLVSEWAIEFLANKGLIIINLGAIYVNGEFDQSRFDKAMEEGLEKAKAPGLTPAQKKAIDDEVIKAFRPFARVSKRP